MAHRVKAKKARLETAELNGNTPDNTVKNESQDVQHMEEDIAQGIERSANVSVESDSPLEPQSSTSAI